MEIEEAKRRAKSGPRLMLVRRIFLLIVMAVSIVTVARLLSPKDYGLANMSAVILSFAQIFRDFGMSNAVLRKGSISQAELSMIFWFNVATTSALALLIVCLAPIASWFYGEPIVQWTMLVSAVSFLIGGVALQHRALINRDLRFGTTAAIDIFSALIGFVTTLALAFAYRNVWAIVIGNAVQSCSGGLLGIAFSRWRPGPPRRSAEFGDLLRFGANSSIFSISVFLSNNMASILIGRFLGPADLGQFNRGQAIYQVPSQNVIQPVVQGTMPLLTRLRAHPEEYRTAYLDLIQKLSVMLFPISITLVFAGVPLAMSLLGDRWYHAGLALSGFAPALVASALAYAISDLFVTQDRAAELRNLGLIECVTRIGFVAIGIPFGLAAVAGLYSLSNFIVMAVRVRVAGRKGSITARDQIHAVIPAISPSIGAAILAGSAWLLLADAARPVQAAGIMASGAVGMLATALLHPPSRLALGKVVDTFLGYRVAKMLRLV